MPVVDHWWQTETGWAICANCLGLHEFQVKEGSPTKPAPGWNLQVVDSDNRQVAPGEIGALVVKLPLPPGALPTLWQNDARYVESYLEEFPGYYKTADAGYIDADGYAFVMSRTDDIINVPATGSPPAPWRRSSPTIPTWPSVRCWGLMTISRDRCRSASWCSRPGSPSLRKRLSGGDQMVRERIGPVAAFKTATVVKRLPKTRSGKILRGTIQKIADNKDYNVPATIDDPASLARWKMRSKASATPAAASPDRRQRVFAVLNLRGWPPCQPRHSSGVRVSRRTERPFRWLPLKHQPEHAADSHLALHGDLRTDLIQQRITQVKAQTRPAIGDFVEKNGSKILGISASLMPLRCPAPR